MAITQPAQRRAPEESEALLRERAQAWAEVMQAEAMDPNLLRALRDQQQDLHSRNELR